MDRPVAYGNPEKAIGGHVMGHACLSLDSLVQLKNGDIKRINELIEGTQVIGLNMKSLKQDGGTLYECAMEQKPIYTINAGGIIKSSPQHRFFTVDDDLNFVSIAANELSEGDFLATPSKIYVDGKTNVIPPELHKKRFYTITPIGTKNLKKQFTKKEVFRKHQLPIGITPRQLRRVLNQGYATSKATIDSICNILKLDAGGFIKNYCTVYESNKQKLIKIPKTVTPKIAQVLGYIEGDGHIAELDIRIKDNRKEVLRYYEKLVKDLFNVKTTIKKVKNKDCYQLRFNSVDVVRLFNWIKQNKAVIYTSSEKVISSYIRGFFDAEGSALKTRVSFFLKDEETIHIIQMLLLRLGISSSLRPSGNGYRIQIIPYSEREKYAKKIGFTASDKKQKLEESLNKKIRNKEVLPINKKTLVKLLKEINPKYEFLIKPKKTKNITRGMLEKTLKKIMPKDKSHENISNIRKILDGDIYWKRVSSIETTIRSEKVIDIQIEPLESFIADAFYSHNSTLRLHIRKGRQQKRIIEIVKSPYLPEREAVFMITERGIEDVKDNEDA